MSEQKFVYLVTDHSGHGESYHLRAAFSTHAAADRAVARLRQQMGTHRWRDDDTDDDDVDFMDVTALVLDPAPDAT